MIGRRRFLMQSSGLLLASMTGCKPRITRAGVLENLVTSLLTQDVHALLSPSTQLAEHVALLRQGPRAVAKARASFVPALLAWQRVHAFRVGPAVETSALFRSTYWPPRLVNVERERLGVDSKGLFALELMLFGQPSQHDQQFFTGARAERDVAFASALARDVRERARAAIAAQGDGRAFAKRFASAPDGISQLLNLLVETGESLAADRLAHALTLHTQGRLVEGALPGSLSQVSADILVCWLTVMQRIYTGAHQDGLTLLVQQVSAQTDARVRTAFDTALRDVRKLGPSLEASVVRGANDLSQAAKSARALEVLFKTELASALGVTISIASGDGD
jgi:uncharacterized protein